MQCDSSNSLKSIQLGVSISKILNCSIIKGSEYNDRLIGDNITKEIYGMGGNDVISSKGGNITIIGGEGGDRYVIPKGDAIIKIKDFEVNNGEEKIDLSFFKEINKFKDIKKKNKGEGTEIILGDKNRLILEYILPEELKENNFIIVEKDKQENPTETWWFTTIVGLGSTVIALVADR